MMNDKINEQEVRTQELADEKLEEVSGGRSGGMRTLMKDKAFADVLDTDANQTGSVAPKPNGIGFGFSKARQKNP